MGGSAPDAHCSDVRPEVNGAVVGAGGRAAAAAAAAAIVDVDVDVDVDDFAEPRRIRRRHRGLQSANGAARELLATARQRRGKPAAIFFFCDDNNNNNNNSNNNAKGTRRTFGRTRFDGRAASQFLFDDDDEKNEAEEYELWKIRELKRIKRDKEERLERQAEMELIERRRMTDAEREEDDKRMDSKAAKREDVKQFTFLQKYYHRGTFFQDKAASGEEPLYNRDYHEPTAEETFDKNLLPKAMQLRRGQFGKKGQVKHTHLTDVDTTDQTAAWSQHTKVMEKYQEKMAAAKSINVFDRASISASSRDPPS